MYVNETIRNCKIRWDEHNDVNINSEPAKHLPRSTEHELVDMYLFEHLKVPSKDKF